jgi:hypothetical protein
MPLIAFNLDQARSAYSALELRASAAELHISTLQNTVDTLKAAQATVVDRAALLTQYTVAQAQSNAQLVAQQTSQVSPDISLESFIGTLGLAVALGEASMPDRAVNSVKATLQAYLTFDTGADGVSKSVGVRFYQPELGQATALMTASFEIAKVPPAPGVPAPRSLYNVLQSKQALYTSPFWMQFSAGTPPAAPAAQIIAAISATFGAIGGWTLPFLIGQASTIATLETTLAARVAATGQADAVAAYSSAVQALSSLVASLSQRAAYVAGDLYALSTSLDATTRAAQAIGG